MADNVVRGPWAPAVPVRVAPKVPHRDRAGRLTKCLDCQVPFHPRRPIPEDQLCRECRDARVLAALPTLFDQPP